jgi:hypothetical protein
MSPTNLRAGQIDHVTLGCLGKSLPTQDKGSLRQSRGAIKVLAFSLAVESFPIPSTIRNGNGRNKIILPEFRTAKGSMAIWSWQENCRTSFFSNLRAGEIGQGTAERMGMVFGARNTRGPGRLCCVPPELSRRVTKRLVVNLGRHLMRGFTLIDAFRLREEPANRQSRRAESGFPFPFQWQIEPPTYGSTQWTFISLASMWMVSSALSISSLN